LKSTPDTGPQGLEAAPGPEFDLALTWMYKRGGLHTNQPGNPSLVVSERELTLYQRKEIKMALRLGDIAPDFTADTTEGPIRFHEWIGDSWAVLFSHPKDFTPVCTTELGECARLKPEFDRRGVKVIGLSVDKTDSHSKWAEDIRETQGTALNFPVIADPDHKVAELYDMIHPEISDVFTVRSVFIIGPDKKIKLMITYPASTGRNFDEILRVIDSLQLTAKYSVATPVNWKDGDDVIIVPSMSDEDAKAKFPAGWKAPKPYLRITPQPNKTAATDTAAKSAS
jgi:alkyl hydroperoxide reductase subunit AhpC